MANEETRKHGIAFEVDFNNHETIDISIKLDLTERLAVKTGEAGASTSSTWLRYSTCRPTRTSSGSYTPARPCWPNGARPRPRHERRPARAGSLGRRPAGQAATGPAPRHQSQGGH
ncbi:phage tail protein [Janthinobacterium sp. ZB1P44]|uniref:phage tail protein n=1 Tax=Janthinobacterium sp. ZB1P44 TaxID=3424192 RepID=UPI003F1F125C